MDERLRPSDSVYVIDDDSHVRSGLVNLFESVRLQAHAFGSTAEFLAFSRPDAPQCLVLDVRLPGLSGLDFQSQLARASIEIPIVFLTGYGDIPMSVKAMKAGAVEFLTKPVREQDLLDAVRVAIEASRANRERSRMMAELRRRFESLNARQREVMALIAAGNMNKQIGAKIGISEATVRLHRRKLMKKMGAKTLADLLRMAGHLGNLPLSGRCSDKSVLRRSAPQNLEEGDAQGASSLQGSIFCQQQAESWRLIGTRASSIAMQWTAAAQAGSAFGGHTQRSGRRSKKIGRYSTAIIVELRKYCLSKPLDCRARNSRLSPKLNFSWVPGTW